jgi:transcriptional regulator NrdR family protein
MQYKPVNENTCPECGAESRVMRTYYTDARDVARRRCCRVCDHKFWTLASGEEPLSNQDYRVRYPSKGTTREKLRLVRIERR